MRKGHVLGASAVLSCGLALAWQAPAHAVVPGLFQPLQQLLSVLPAMLAMVAAVVLLWFASVRRLCANAARAVAARPQLMAVLVLAVVAVPAAYFGLSGRGATAQSQPLPANPTWSCFRGNLARSGCMDDIAPPTVPSVAWKFRELLPNKREFFSSSPAVANGKVYVGSWGGLLYCFDAGTGAIRWTFATDGFVPIHSSPAVADGRVYVGEGLHMDSDCFLYCLDEDTGEVLWKFQTGSHTESSPFVVDGKVYIGAGFDGVYCIDAETGEEIWHFENHHVDAAPAVADGLCFFGSGGGGWDDDTQHLFALDAETGEQVWEREYNYPVWGAPACVGGLLYVGMGNGNVDLSDDEPYGAIKCLDAATGQDVWLHEVADGVLGAVAVVDGRAYAGSRDGRLYCLDASTGEEIFSYATSPEDDPMAIVSSPAVAGDQVIFGCEDGMLRSVDRVSGELVWEFDARSLDKLAPIDARILPSPAVAGGRVYCGADNFFFFCLGDTR